MTPSREMNASLVQVGKERVDWGAARWVCAVFVVGFKGWTGETKMVQGLIAPETEGVGDSRLDGGIISSMAGAEKNR